ncbi:DUF2218 domain-containing protein [Halopseudomonas sabulinigri]|uniref:DUF2218 domain-containing protein n=1 Tax=Halopseudomonas sabulinigri TaxID=472181 RepID=A0ABP9ZQF8_9GAMM
MPAKQAQVRTANASRYITRLCKHFAHKVESSWDEQQGVTDFPFGRCVMQAGEVQLELHCSAEDDALLERVCWVVADHLERFSVAVEKGEGLTVEWQAA